MFTSRLNWLIASSWKSTSCVDMMVWVTGKRWKSTISSNENKLEIDNDISLQQWTLSDNEKLLFVINDNSNHWTLMVHLNCDNRFDLQLLNIILTGWWTQEENYDVLWLIGWQWKIVLWNYTVWSNTWLNITHLLNVEKI